MEIKFFQGQTKEHDDATLTLEHFISTEAKDRVGDIVRVDGMVILGRPVVLAGFGRGIGTEPIARPVWIRPGSHKGVKGILARTQFFGDETGRRLYTKARDGFSPNWALGLNPLETRPLPGGGRDIVKWDLLEYSMVGVGMDPGAVTLGFKGLRFGVQAPAGPPRRIGRAELRKAVLKAVNDLVER